MIAWVLLFVAGALEVVWAAALKASHGFSRPVAATIGLATAALSLFLLSVALRSLSVTVAYTVWVGAGMAGVAAYGMIALDEPSGILKLASIALVGIGIIGLAISEG